MRITPLALLPFLVLAVAPARANLHITNDHGGYVEEYKAKYKRIRDNHERVIIDGVANQFDWYENRGGQEVKTMQIDYTRAGKK